MKHSGFRWTLLRIFGWAVVVTAVLMMVMGQKDGVHTAGAGVDYSGVSTGVTLGFIPRFFHAVAEGRALTAADEKTADTPPAAKAKK